MLTLGYGQFHTTDFWGMFSEVFPLLLRWIVPPLTFYVVASIIAELLRKRIAGVVFFLVSFALSVSRMAVMGEWGTAHVAAETGVWAWPLLFGALVTKTVVLIRRDRRAQRIASEVTPA